MQVKYSPFEPKGEKVQRMLFLTYVSGGEEATLIIVQFSVSAGFCPRILFCPLFTFCCFSYATFFLLLVMCFLFLVCKSCSEV